MGDYSKIPQRLHKYPASERAKEIVHKSFTLDTQFSGTWPEQWSSPEAPEFHDEMDKLMAAGFEPLEVNSPMAILIRSAAEKQHSIIQ